jgi:glycosyltransferase involved in cell wall biosynthesis
MPYSFSKVVSFGGYLPILAGPVFTKWMQLPLITLLRGNDFDTSVFNPRRRSLLDDALLASESVGCVSMDEVQKIKKLYPGLRPAYTPNGIESKEWEVLPSDKKFAEKWRRENLNGRLCLGIFGQVKEKKGLEVLLDGIRKSEISQHYFLLVTGAENAQLTDILASSETRFELLPYLDRSELVKYYAACDAVVIPSHYEGMPNVMLEAGALGIPVIASATGGMKDVLADFDASFLFYPGDQEELVLVLEKFRNTPPETIPALKTKWQKYVLDNFNADEELKAYFELFGNEIDG